MQISYKKKITKNLGNYESVSVEIGIEDDVDYEVDTTFEDVYMRIRELVNSKLKKEMLKLEGNQNGK
jgi:hypothetical protein